MNAVDTALTGKNAAKLISGNHACALGAIAAGCRFFAGYPITPSSEIAERLARNCPKSAAYSCRWKTKSHRWRP